MSSLWPRSRLPEALELLARRVGVNPREVALGHPPDEETEGWIQDAASALGVDMERVHAGVDGVRGMLSGLGPGLLTVKDGFYVVLGSKNERVTLLDEDLNAQRVSVDDLEGEVLSGVDSRTIQWTDRFLDKMNLDPKRKALGRGALLSAWLAGGIVATGWVVQLPPSASPWAQLREAGALRLIVVLLGLHITAFGLGLAAWTLLGRGALLGNLDPGWLMGWALLILSSALLGPASSWCQEMLAVRVGALLKRRLLQGVLRLAPDEVRQRGHGQFLALALESEVLEMMALSGGFSSLLALPELMVASAVLVQGEGGWARLGLLGGLLVLVAVLARRVYAARLEWTRKRMELSHEVVARMAGQRTRLAQQAPERWFLGEDQALERTVDSGRTFDHASIALSGAIPRAWMVLGLFTLLPGFASAGVGSLAVGIGGVILVQRGLEHLIGGLQMLMGAAVSWQQVGPLFQAATRSEPVGVPEAAGWLARQRGEVAIEARDLSFRYRSDLPPVLEGASLQVRRGDKLLLEGASGGGKSTLAALLVGLREPDGGLVHVRGLDRATLGARGWRAVITAAPQFHDNHIVSGTFAFNLLLGRTWPPGNGDMQAAQEVAEGLGLGPLLERMPAGLGQMVGEIGWQLSHGEKSRVFLARALLQGADVLVLDESFGALDPENLRLCMDFVLSRAKTLIVIAHP